MMTFFAFYLVLITLAVAFITYYAAFREHKPEARRRAPRPEDALEPWASIHEISEAGKQATESHEDEHEYKEAA